MKLSCIAVLLALTVSAVSATQDNTPPVLTGFTVSPTTINAASAPVSATVTATATDTGGSGVWSIEAVCTDPNNVQTVPAIMPVLAPGFASVSLSATVNFPQRSHTGTWTCSVFVRDAVGNVATYSSSQLGTAGFTSTLTVN